MIWIVYEQVFHGSVRVHHLRRLDTDVCSLLKIVLCCSTVESPAVAEAAPKASVVATPESSVEATTVAKPASVAEASAISETTAVSKLSRGDAKHCSQQEGGDEHVPQHDCF